MAGNALEVVKNKHFCERFVFLNGWQRWTKSGGGEEGLEPPSPSPCTAPELTANSHILHPTVIIPHSTGQNVSHTSWKWEDQGFFTIPTSESLVDFNIPLINYKMRRKFQLYKHLFQVLVYGMNKEE